MQLHKVGESVLGAMLGHRAVVGLQDRVQHVLGEFLLVDETDDRDCNPRRHELSFDLNARPRPRLLLCECGAAQLGSHRPLPFG